MVSIYKEKFFRNLGVISKIEQEKLRKTEIAIVGLGGTGSAAFECLLRLGCENFVLFDRDRFELTNFNRQMLATDETLDEKKINAAIARAKIINKNAKYLVYNEFDPKKIKKAKVVIDGTDNVETRIKIAAACRSRHIPYVFCAASFTNGMVSVFTYYKFEKAFQLTAAVGSWQVASSNELKANGQKLLAKYNTCVSVIAPATMLAGTLAASQTINYLLKRPFTEAPDVLFFDLSKNEMFWKKRLK